MVFGICAAAHVHAQQSFNTVMAADKSASTYQHGSSSLPENKEVERIVEGPLITMILVQASNGQGTDKSCWVRLYDQKNYQGESFLVMGPINLAQMTGPFGINWESKVLSIETGPKANLTIFDNPNFKGENKVIDPNAKISELSRKTGFFDDFQSMRLNCIQPG
jgi:hypothetical protein